MGSPRYPSPGGQSLDNNTPENEEQVVEQSPNFQVRIFELLCLKTSLKSAGK